MLRHLPRLSLLALPVLLPAQHATPHSLAQMADAAAGGEVSVRPVVAPVPAGSSLMTPQAMPGWPKQLPIHPRYSFAPSRNLSLVDLDADGQKEIVFPNTDSKVYAWRLDGSAVPGWPVATVGFGQLPATIADLDGDGTKEIVVPTRGLTSGGRLYVFKSNGQAMPGWPKNLNNNNVSSGVVVVDLDGDGKLEILAQERRYPIGYVHAFKLDGTPFGGSWPLALDHVPAMTPAVGDLDGDGKLEIVIGSYNSLYVTDTQGRVRTGFPVDVSTRSANFSYQSPALGDIDGDGKLEIVTACHKSAGGCYVFRENGTLQTGFPKSFGGWTYSPPVLVDLDGNGRLDILCGRAGGPAAGNTMYAWTGSGAPISGFPTRHPGGGEGLCTVADIDGDGSYEILYDSNLLETATKQGYLHCVDTAGRPEAGFPLRVEGLTYMNGATVGDVDGNGALELAVVSSNTSSSSGGRRGVTVGLYTMPGPTAPGKIGWKTYHEGDERRGRERESDRFALTGHAVLGGSLRLEQQGAPSAPHFVLLGTGVGLLPSPPHGVLRIDSTRPIVVLSAGVLPATGRRLMTLPIPNDARLRGLTLAMQGLDQFRLFQMAHVRIR